MALSREVIGQPLAVRALTQAAVRALAGASEIGGTLGAVMFLGPPGTGKSHSTAVLARILCGPQGMPFTIDCRQLLEFAETLQIARALRPPAGELRAWETQAPGVVVFDRLDAAPESFKRTLLAILERGFLPADDQTFLDFRRSICVLLTQLGSKEILHAMEGRIGFDAGGGPEGEDTREGIVKQCFDAAESCWGPQIMSRLDHFVVFHQLHVDHVCKILDLRIARHRGALLQRGIDLVLADSARDFLVGQSVATLRYGARQMQQALARYLEYPLADLLLSGRLPFGASLYVTRGPSGLHFQIIELGRPRSLVLPPGAGVWRHVPLPAPFATPPVLAE